jgi:hypothetical protein
MRAGLAAVPNETPWVAVGLAKASGLPPSVRAAVVPWLVISALPNVAPAPNATLLAPEAVAPLPTAIPPPAMARALVPMAMGTIRLTYHVLDAVDSSRVTGRRY